MRITTEQERRFFDMVRAGATVLCSQDVYDAIKRLGYHLYQVELCRYLEAGTMVAVDKKMFEPPALSLTDWLLPINHINFEFPGAEKEGVR